MITKNSKVNLIILIIAFVLIVIITAGYLIVPKGVSAININDSHGAVQDEIKVYLDISNKLECTVEPVQFADRRATYETADPSIAIVDDQGLLTGVAIGHTILQVKVVNCNEKINIVVLPSVKDIKGIEKEIELTEGNITELNAEIVVADQSINKKDIPVSYSSSKEDIASVDEKGTITAVKEGTTTIKISAGGYTKTVDVNVKEPVTYTPPASHGNSSGGHSNGGGSSSGGGDSGGGWE